jgi:sarcosine oxidase, subunit alpha
VSNGYRLAAGGLIDRNRTLSFAYNGQSYQGHPGDTLASALIASGVNVIGRSFKYHRPRGFYGVGVEDPNSMLAVRDAYGYDPALRAGQVRLCEGLNARSVTGWPSPNFDLAGGLQLAAGILSAGFYYKTFKWPNWSTFEPLIRRSTGFGRPQALRETRAVCQRHASFDVLIIGGGPAGLVAARSLVGSGLTVLLADDQPQFGGTLNWEQTIVDDQPGSAWARGIAAELATDANLTLLPSTTVTAAYEGNHFTLLQLCSDERGVLAEWQWKIFARQVVLATGMVDRPLLFAGNDRPGIMLSSAVRRLMGEFGVAPSRDLVVYTNNDSGYLTALAAHRAGIHVESIIDVRPRERTPHADEIGRAGITCHFETQIEATAGYKRLVGIAIRSKDGRRRKISCNGLAVSGGFTPLLHLASHRGAKPIFDERLGAFVATALPDQWQAAGGVAGTLDLEQTMAAAHGAALNVATALHATTQSFAVHVVRALAQDASVPVSLPTYGSSSEMWVDFQNDVKVSDIELAARENYRSVEHLKRYTTLGMGTDQGRTSNFNGLAVMADVTGTAIEAVGTTTFRPPYIAVRMATVAAGRRGDLFKPRRLLPAHAVHHQLAAVFEDFGWERPNWYRSNAPDFEPAVALEMVAVRSQVGVFDSSSLGKIEVTGPDAAAFLSRFYVANMSTLRPGRVRYSLMLREDGVIFDDGVVACLGDNHFLASPTSGNADAVAAWFERWRQTEWPMRVAISAVTSNWASIAVAGPRARALLARLEPDFDISNSAFGHMEIREGQVGGVPARVARVSFTGELQYEISVPARYAGSMVKALLIPEGDLRPRIVGLEAWLRLRLEKGYLHLGSDTNGRTTPLDVGLADVVAKRKGDFIGKRSLALPFATSAEREQLVGLVAVGELKDDALEVGGRILSAGHSRPPCRTDGYVTSACFSPSIGKSIGLALIERGRSRLGEIVSVYSQGKTLRFQIVNPMFYDTGNSRLQA